MVAALRRAVDPVGLVALPRVDPVGRPRVDPVGRPMVDPVGRPRVDRPSAGGRRL